MASKKGTNKLSIGVDEDPKDVVARVVQQLMKEFPESSPIESLLRLTKHERESWLNSLSGDEVKALEYDWNFFARPQQREPSGGWKRWINCCGRGWGKTKTASETIRHWIESGQCRHIALVAANAKDLRSVMVEEQRGGGSGIMQVCPPWNKPHYSPTTMSIEWTNPNFKSYGAVCKLYSAEEPSSLRGPAHDGAWVDEICKFAQMEEVWDMLQMGLRIGVNPKVLISTTPRPLPFFKKLLEMEGSIVTYGSTFDNKLNLASGFIESILEMYEGTRIGKQELYAAILDDVVGALWTSDLIKRATLHHKDEMPTLLYRVVGVDPQMTFGPGSLTGIVVAGVTKQYTGDIARPPHAYVLDDMSINGSPKDWATAVCHAYNKYDCQLVLAERNQGGELVADNIRSVDPNVRVKLITATKSKGERAVPVVGKYEQNRVFHVANFGDLVQEMLSFVPGDEKKKRSPNRVDALVHALDFLLIGSKRAGAGIAIGRRI